MKDFDSLLNRFLMEVVIDEIYNEASLQFELGCYLRKNLFNVKFEVNIKTLDDSDSNMDLYKKEIDLLVVDENKNQFLIELKAPMMIRKCSEPKQSKQGYSKAIADWEVDILFLNKMKQKGFNCYSIFFTDDCAYYSGNSSTKSHLGKFRNGSEIMIEGPVGELIEAKSSWQLNTNNSDYNYFIFKV
jgi:hypothetical protein